MITTLVGTIIIITIIGLLGLIGLLLGHFGNNTRQIIGTGSIAARTAGRSGSIPRSRMSLVATGAAKCRRRRRPRTRWRQWRPNRSLEF
jgi:hypothetical protein